MAKPSHSFKSVLKEYCHKINPQKILEWGPGTSTKVMLDSCPDSEIYTIEHSTKWFKRAKTKFSKYDNVQLLQKSVGKNSSYASTGFKFAPYDLIFVDGRRRVECCFVAMQCISEDGVILLHDCERKNYRSIVDSFIDIIEERDGTLVFRAK